MERSVGLPESLRLDVRELHHLAPLFGFLDDELSKVGGRACKRRGAQFGDSCPQPWIGWSRVYLPVELVDDLGWRALGRADAVERAGLVARYEVPHGRDVWQHLRARRCCDRQRAELAV